MTGILTPIHAACCDRCSGGAIDLGEGFAQIVERGGKEPSAHVVDRHRHARVDQRALTLRESGKHCADRIAKLEGMINRWHNIVDVL